MRSFYATSCSTPATTYVADGTCMAYQLYFDTPSIKRGYGTYNFVSFFVIPVVIFVNCYARIVVAMRKQMRVMAGHNLEASSRTASHSQYRKTKWNVIKTMIIVIAFFVVSWFPLNTYRVAQKSKPLSRIIIKSY